MKQVLKTVLILGAALLVVLAVRAHFLTVYTVPVDLDQQLTRGDRVLVNKLSHASPIRGDLVVFRQQGDLIGRVTALPGDTITLDSARFRIPTRCCNRCTAPGCRLYLVTMGHAQTLVYKHQMVGRATKLFHLPY